MKKIYILAATALALVACDNTEDNPIAGNVEARFTATIGQSSPTRASGTEWGKNDEIGISTIFQDKVGPYINMEYTTTNGDGIFSGNTIYIYNPMSVTAYYPFKGTEGTAADIFTVTTTADKQTPDKQPEFDFLFARLDDIDSDNPDVELNFSHMMSKLTFVFKNGEDGAPDVSKITSYAIDKLSLTGTFDPATGKCEVNSEAEVLTFDVTRLVSDNEPLQSIILFPQKVNELKLTLTDKDNQHYSCNLNITDNELKAGMHYQFTITVSKKRLKLTAMINDWNTIELKDVAESDDDD